jgi:hypothetical protein
MTNSAPSWPGSVPAIHVFLLKHRQDVDARDRPGHDELNVDARHSSGTTNWAALELNFESAATPSWPGLSRPSTSCRIRRMAGGWVYILTNRPNGILYVGVTSDLVRRIYEHRSGFVAGFTRRYGLKRLVYFEQFDDIRCHSARTQH